MSLDPDLFRLSPPEVVIGAWLLTYLVHSTLLIAAAALLNARRWGVPDALRESLWKVALFGGILTATVQLGLGPRLVGVDWILVAGEPIGVEAPGTTRSAEFAHIGPALRSSLLPSSTASPAFTGATRSTPTVSGMEVHRESSAIGTPAAGIDRVSTVVSRLRRGRLAWLVILPPLLGLTVLAWRRRCFHRSIAGRQVVVNERLLRTLEQMRRQAGWRWPLRLTSSESLTSPVALGIRRSEICLPTRALEQMDERSLESMLAHELAHHLRRDPLTLTLWHLLEIFLFLQPLNRWARHRWQELAEYRSDAIAARLMGDGLPLARCLTEVAGWMIEARRSRAPSLSPGMATRPSTLALRVARLCRPDAPAGSDLRRAWHALPGGGLLLVAVLLAPGFSMQGESAPHRSDESPIEAPPCAMVEMVGTMEIGEIAAIERLPLPDALDALLGELEGIDAEVQALRHELDARDEGREYAEWIDEITRRAHGLRSRRLAIEETAVPTVSPPLPNEEGRKPTGSQRERNERSIR
jgi:Zn-dependent protease with chaperone function